MRKTLFRWHLAIGKVTALLLILWPLTGAIMVIGVVARGVLEPAFPKSKPEISLAGFRLSPRQLSPAGVSKIELRQFEGRSWYELAMKDGSLLALDGKTGKPVAPLLTEAEVRREAGRRLAGTPWSVQSVSLVTVPLDFYDEKEFPVYRLVLDGPGGMHLYASAKDGSPVKTVSRLRRGLFWAGFAFHTWELKWFKNTGRDTYRRFALALLIALPVLTTGLVAYALLAARKLER